MDEFKFIKTAVSSILIFIVTIIIVGYFYNVGVFHENQLCVEKFGIETCKEINNLNK